MAFLMNDHHVTAWELSNLSKDWYALNDKKDTPVFNVCDYKDGKGVIVYSEIISDISLLDEISEMLNDLKASCDVKRCLLWVEQSTVKNLVITKKNGMDVVKFNSNQSKPCCEIFMNIQNL